MLDLPSVPNVSVIVVNYNTCDILRGCLQSIAEQTQSPHEVIVIDNASGDGSAAMVAAEFPQAVLIANDTNKGFAAANNQGLKIARGAHVLLLNPDTIILDRAIDKMLDWMALHPEVGCAGCQVLEAPGVIQPTCFRDQGLAHLAYVKLGGMALARRFPRLGWPEYSWWERKCERVVDVVTGMFMLVPRPVLEKVGPLDDAFFIFSEEADWCRRIRAAGWLCMFTPIAQIIHLDGGSKSVKTVRCRMHVQLEKSQLIYVRKHQGRLAYALAGAMFVASDVAKFAVFGLASMLNGEGNARARVRLVVASLAYLVLGQEPFG